MYLPVLENMFIDLLIQIKNKENKTHWKYKPLYLFLNNIKLVQLCTV